MPTTWTDEEVGVEAQKPVTWTDADVGIESPKPVPELSVKLSPYEQADISSFAAGKGKSETGMEPGTDLTSAVANDPVGFAKAIPSIAMGAVTAPGKLAYNAAADLISKAYSGYDSGIDKAYGGNLASMMRGEDVTPAEKFIGVSAKTNPNIAVAANIAKTAPEFAAMGVMGGLPAWANRLIAAGFSIDMIRKAPEAAAQLGDELGKNKEDQDAGKIASLKSDLMQTAVFAPLAGAGAAHGLVKPRGEMQGPMATGEVLQMPQGSPPVRRPVFQIPDAVEKPAAPVAAVEPPAASPVAEPAKAATPLDTFYSQLETGDIKGGNKLSKAAGAAVTSIDDLNTLADLQERYSRQAKEVRAMVESAKTPEEKMALMNQAIPIGQKASLAREAIEYATNSGSWKEGEGRISYGKRPLDWRDNPEVEKWIEGNANRIGWKQSEIEGKPVEHASLKGFREDQQARKAGAPTDTPEDLQAQLRKEFEAVPPSPEAPVASAPEPAAPGAKPAKFIGSAEPGEVIEGRRVLANENTKKGAEAAAQMAKQQPELLGAKPVKETDDAFLKRIAPKVDANEKLTPAEKQRYDKLTKEPEKPEGGVQVQSFGGGARLPKVPAPPGAPPQPTPPAPVPETPVTQEQSAALQNSKTPGLSGILSLLLPSAKGPASLRAAETLGSKLGPMHQREEAAAAKLRPFSRMFDKLGVQREGLVPADNPGIRFMSDMSQGRPQKNPALANAAKLVEQLFAARIALLEKAGAALQTVRENYFPGMWTKESRLAFNAAIEKLGPDFDLADATPAQKAAVKELVDQFITDGTVSEKDAMGYLTRKPIAGKESFRKQKVFDDIMDAAEFGLRPVSNNPIDLVQLKLAEMDKSIMAHQYFQALKASGNLRIINPYEQVPDGWVKINDKYGTIYGPPTVTIPEYIDKQVYQGLLKVAKDLGINHERLMRFPPGPGSQALGLSFQGQNRILSRFGTETSVIAHEIGHQLDLKYGLWDYLTGGEKGNERNSPIQKELRAIADDTERGANARKKEEKMAQVMEAYIHAPERMREIAPTLFAKFDEFVKGIPELKPFSEIKPGLALEHLAGEKYVGLPILGYRIAPETHGEIINNYLSSSLYNNRYFGDIYKGWMGTANTLNQTQLGMGSAFHAGFTTGEAQISSGANILKDVYGVIRGNRTAGDLGTSVLKNVSSVIRNPVIGDRVLNAWREADGQINPKIAQVVRAAELAGGGFKLESGLQTEQTVKMMRDWYSGNRLKAAARSPFALTELLAKPTMDFLVPRQKAGVFADLAWRIIEQNPGKSLEELTPQFRQAWNRIDARLGQVRYDRLFTNNTAKNVVQGLVRAPGWSGGTIAEIGGGFTDAGKFMSEWVKTGKLPENLPDRTAYVLSLLTTVTATNAALTYAFTGQQPHGLDFFAFRTGHKDEQGREERFLIPSYMKDILAYASHPGETLLNKAHPLISMLSDLAKNKDYYGVEIRGRDASLPTQAAQTVAYVVKSFEPFWTRGTRRERERGADLLSARTIAPLVGVMPAPRSVTQTKAEALAHEMMLNQIPAGARTREQAERSRINAEKHKGEDYLVRTVKRLSADSAVRVWQKSNPGERKKLQFEVESKIRRSRTLDADEKDRLLSLVREGR